VGERSNPVGSSHRAKPTAPKGARRFETRGREGPMDVGFAYVSLCPSLWAYPPFGQFRKYQCLQTRSVCQFRGVVKVLPSAPNF